jgi:AAA family ATP:ADP antiporter
MRLLPRLDSLKTWWPNRTTLAMFAIVFLLHLAFALLRSARMAIAVADLGGSAACLPLFEIFAAVPVSVLVMAALNRTLRSRSLSSTFTLAIGAFLLFFSAFAFVAYPAIAPLRGVDLGQLDPLSAWWRKVWLLGAGGLFYAMSELWRTVLITVLFWSATNHWLSSEQASRHYPRLVLVGSCGAMAAGPIASLTTSTFWQGLIPSAGAWQQTLQLMTVVVLIAGLATAWMFPRLLKALHQGQAADPARAAPCVSGPQSHSLLQSVKICASSLPLVYLAISTMTDYISYSLGEIVFLDALRRWAPAPQDFYETMGMLGTISGVLTALGGAWIAPWWFRKMGWGAAAIATPVAIAVFGSGFCAIVWFEPTLVELGFDPQWLLSTAVALGGCHYAVCRAIKYTLFDPAKELAYMKIDPVQRIPGKVVVDGLVARTARGLSSLFTVGLTTLAGSLRETAGVGGLIASGFATLGGWAAHRLNRELHPELNRPSVSDRLV